MANEVRSGAESRDELSPERRAFLGRLSLVLGALSALIVAIPVVGFILGPLLEKFPRVWRRVGAVDDFKVGETVKVDFLDPSPLAWAGVTAQTAAWLRRTGESSFVAFTLHCTHLGCPVRWIATADLFLCPCHGGVFYADGSVAAGPPPRSLPRVPVRVRDGQVEILASAVPLSRWVPR
jgi:menaquinol-cytochrome c reductase iron-sulfur subunit